jgi:hypothetical protein
MQAMPAALIRFSVLLLLFFSTAHLCCAQEAPAANCRDTINIITDAYNAGQWSVAKRYAREFIKHSRVKESGFFLSTEYRIFNSRDCDADLPQVYYYLIKSCSRLFEVDSAALAYEESLTRGLDLKNDSLEKDLGCHFKTNRLVVSIFGGVNNPLTKYNYKLGFQLGVGNIPLFFELSYRDKYFNHISDQVSGGFGKTLAASNAFPKYKFNFTGHEHLVEAGYFAKLPLQVASYIPRFFFPYSIAGISVSYYFNSTVSKYSVDITKALPDTSISYVSGMGRSMNRIDELNMDLTNFYSNRFSYGAFGGFGGCFILTRELVLFCEARYYIGTNYRYKYEAFNTFRPGVNNFSFTIGLAKSKNKVTVSRN